MDNSLLISQYIQTILDESEEIKAILKDKPDNIFHLIWPENIQFPYIVHGRDALTVTYTKDIEYSNCGWTNNITYSILCISDNYDQCIELANAVRHAVETYRWRDKDIYIHPIQLESAIEYTIERTYVEDMKFTMAVE